MIGHGQRLQALLAGRASKDACSKDACSKDVTFLQGVHGHSTAFTKIAVMKEALALGFQAGQSFNMRSVYHTGASSERG